MRRPMRFEKLVALPLIVSLSVSGAPLLAAPATASISGKVLRMGSGEPVTAAVVKLALRPEEKIYASERSDSSGRYSIRGLPAGTYEVAVDSGSGIYAVTGSFTLQPGEVRQVSLAVKDEPEEDEEPGEPEEPGEATPTTPTEPAPPAAPKSKLAELLRKPWFGASLVVGTALIIGAIVKNQDDDKPASASPAD